MSARRDILEKLVEEEKAELREVEKLLNFARKAREDVSAYELEYQRRKAELERYEEALTELI